MIQTILVILLFLLSAGFLVWQLVKAVKGKPATGCDKCAGREIH